MFTLGSGRGVLGEWEPQGRKLAGRTRFPRNGGGAQGSLMGAAVNVTEVCVACHVRFRKWKRDWYLSNKLVCMMLIID